jgi:hypothetical protein
MPWHTKLKESLQAEIQALPADNELIVAWHNLARRLKALLPRFPIDYRDDPDVSSFRTDFERLLRLFHTHAPRMAAVYGKNLPLWAMHELCRAGGIESDFLPAARIERLSPDNPLTVTPDGTLAGWEAASVPHYAALSMYKDSLRPPQKRGRKKRLAPRPAAQALRLDPVLATKVYQRSMDGAKWEVIAKQYLPEYDLRDKLRRDAARKKIGRLIYCGKLLAKKVGR